jgi:hypothetical protein
MNATTDNTPVYSSSAKIGSRRWLAGALVGSAGVQRAYLLDMKYQSGVPQRWCLITLVEATPGAYEFQVRWVHSEDAASLEGDVLAAVHAAPPSMSVSLGGVGHPVAIERFERVVSNVMHNLLTPLPAVDFIWQRFATTDGVGAYAPR